MSEFELSEHNFFFCYFNGTILLAMSHKGLLLFTTGSSDEVVERRALLSCALVLDYGTQSLFTSILVYTL